MKVAFLNKFSKDIESLNQKSIKNNLIKLINQIEEAESLSDIVSWT